MNKIASAMKKIIFEILGSAALVLLPTAVIYQRLSGEDRFWNAQFLWSLALVACWAIVAAGYFNQGYLVHVRGHAENVSVLLPVAVFLVQCILFVKGVYYGDWSLVGGALIVNSGVVFSLYQIGKAKRFWRE